MARPFVFNSPIRQARPAMKMPTTMAKVSGPCPLCERRVKAGTRVALHFESGFWAHVGCVVLLVSQQRLQDA